MSTPPDEPVATTPAANRHNFVAVLVNTFFASLTTSFLWFALVFWIYLETRSVLANALLGGAYTLLLAVVAVPFGSFIDRTRKRRVMLLAQVVTAICFSLAMGVYLLVPHQQLIRVNSPAFWLLAILVLAGAIVESARSIALSTTVTLLIAPAERARANGLVGMVTGLTFAVTSVFSGLAIGRLGMGLTMAIAMGLTIISLLHLARVDIPEPEIVHLDGRPAKVDFRGAWQAIMAVPGLIALLLFSTFNNALGGVYTAMLDPYGLTLVSVEVWGVLWGVLSFGFLIGGALVARFGLGTNPLRALLLANVVMWTVGTVMTLRESIVLLSVGILIYMIMMPIAEAGEQTLLQRLVPFEKQGRVFGLAGALEIAAMPATAFVIGPIAQYVTIPYLRSEGGRRSWEWLLGPGEARGMALLFVAASLIGLLVTLLALVSPPYRVLSRQYAQAPASGPGATPEGTA